MFWWHANFQLGTNCFGVSEKITPFKNPYLIALFETHFFEFSKKRKGLQIGGSQAKKVPNRAKIETPKTLIGTNIWHKNPQKKHFCSAKMAPQEVVQILALQGVQFQLSNPLLGYRKITLQHACMYIYMYIHTRGGPLPKFMPISFSGAHLVFEVFQDTWHFNKENPSVYWIASLSCPLMASYYANRCIVLTIPCPLWNPRGVGNAGCFLSRFASVHLAFYRFRQKWPYSHTNAVAHIASHETNYHSWCSTPGRRLRGKTGTLLQKNAQNALSCRKVRFWRARCQETTGNWRGVSELRIKRINVLSQDSWGLGGGSSSRTEDNFGSHPPRISKKYAPQNMP